MTQTKDQASHNIPRWKREGWTTRFPLFNPEGAERGEEVVGADRGWHVTNWKEVPPLHRTQGEQALRQRMQRGSQKTQLPSHPQEWVT